MNAKADAQTFQLDWLKWILVVGLIAAGVVGNAMYSDYPILYRVLALLGLGVVALFVAINTAKGAALWDILKEAQVEVRKVVWPTREETNKTTLIVVALVAVMALILMGLDALLGWLTSLIIG